MTHGAYFGDLSDAIQNAKLTLFRKGKDVSNSRWQGIDVTSAPQGNMFELFDYSFSARIPASIQSLKMQTQPNLPWADDHFMERVGGQPTNPGEQYMNWPFFKRQAANDRFRGDEGKHSHTYMERIWTKPLEGIRYEYGNLMDVVNLLEREPYTRQAFLPLWFPEDTGAVHGERVPCSLGYHFMLRNGELHIFYPIRSCDLYRHFQDDIYMACRLLLWVLEELQSRELNRDIWRKARPGKLRMDIFSLHIFQAEYNKLRKEVAQYGD